jgi:hypothetical protein
MTENEYLDRREATTREALADSAQRIEAELSRAVPLEQIVRDHPVLSLGAGAAGGVAAGFLVGKVLGTRAGSAVLGAVRMAARPGLLGLRRSVIASLFGSSDTADDGS